MRSRTPKMKDFDISVYLTRIIPESGETEMNHNRMVRILLDNGANPNYISGPSGISVLAGAIIENNEEIVKLLLEKGANPDPNALLFAHVFRNQKIIDMLEQKQERMKST